MLLHCVHKFSLLQEDRDGVYAGCWEYEGSRYVVAVNSADAARHVELPVAGTTAESLRAGSPAPTVGGGTLTLDLPAMGSAVVKVAGNLKNEQKATAVPALTKVLELCQDKGLRAQAEEALKKLPKRKEPVKAGTDRSGRTQTMPSASRATVPIFMYELR